MPHVIVKLWPGKSEAQKAQLAERITKDVMAGLNYGEASVSVAIEEVPAEDWAEKVYKPATVSNSEKPLRSPQTLRPDAVKTLFVQQPLQTGGKSLCVQLSCTAPATFVSKLFPTPESSSRLTLS